MSTGQRLLRESIAVHKLKRDSKEEAAKGVKGQQCPLCREYGEGKDCADCPVRVATKHLLCHGTPWRALEQAFRSWNHELNGAKEPFLWLAYQKAEDVMIAFLESLLTEGE